MGFNKRKMASERAAVAAQEAEARHALGPQVVEDAKRPIADWNERQSKHMPLLLSPTIEAPLLTNHWFLWVRGARPAEPPRPSTFAGSIATAARR
jgi:hypothetical protein